ncbi:MAG: transcriptional regulator [Comamonadaceae bacterium]|nr:MAG: transcriptional regulator [Comamonadaceae bacterium]
MASKSDEFPIGNLDEGPVVVRSSQAIGIAVRARRHRLALTQAAVAGLGNTGNRFVVDLENGKPTVQLQKVIDLMDLLGLELIVRQKSSEGGRQ